jgi:dienelactone hydrolase
MLSLATVAACGPSSTPVAGPSAIGAVDGDDHEWPRVPTMGSGTAAYADGAWAYEDYVYDSAAGRSGNSGDLAVLQIALSEDAVRYVAKLNSYVDEDPTRVALAVDTDCNDATGGGEWPNASAVRSSGWEFIIEAGDAGAQLLFRGQAPIALASVASRQNNVIEFDVPRSLADPLLRHADGTSGYQRWCYRGLVGLGRDTWSQTTNVLFRNRIFDQGTAATDESESTDTFQTERQAAALQSGDFTDFRREVDFDLIASGANLRPEPPAGNLWLTRIYDAPDFPNGLPEGAHQAENSIQSLLYNGRFQPYMVYVPQSYRDDPRPAPMLPMLHGIFSTHRNNGWPLEDGAFWSDVVQPNRMILAMPLARGQESWYEHVGEVDVLAVIDDVRRLYNIDADRQFLGGASMGGLGALKIAAQHPDLFAGLILSVPPMSDRLQGYVIPQANEYDLVELAGSLRNIPLLNLYGALDPIVPPALNSDRLCRRLAELGYEYDCWLDLAGSHYSFYNPRFAEIKQLIEGRRVVRDPAQVTYRSHPAFRWQAHRAGVSGLLPYESAYWVRNIVYAPLPTNRIDDCLLVLPNNANLCMFPVDEGLLQNLIDGAGITTIDVRSHGTGVGDPVVTAIADDPDPILVRQGAVLAPGPAVTPRNGFDLFAENVVAFDLELARMGLSLDEELSAGISGNGVVRLGLRAAYGRPCSASLAGAPIEVIHEAMRVQLELSLPDPAAVQTLVIRCSG